MANLVATDLIQGGNRLKVKLEVTNCSGVSFDKTDSPEYIIRGSVVFQARVTTVCLEDSDNNNFLLFIRFSKILRDDDLTYTIKISSPSLDKYKLLSSDDGTIWHLMKEEAVPLNHVYVFDVTVLLDFIPRLCLFATLHEDKELTDFELKGEDGSVDMHRAVLAASSPVLRTMLGGTWKETTKGAVDLPGTSHATLQNFKDYIYLHTLPKLGLEELLLLASYYMMPDLEQKCIDKLVNNMTAENAVELLEFSCKNNMRTLMLVILECVEGGVVKVSEIRDGLGIKSQT